MLTHDECRSLGAFWNAIIAPIALSSWVVSEMNGRPEDAYCSRLPWV